MEGLVVDSETWKRQESRSSGAWVAVAALNARKKTPTEQSSSFIEPPRVGYVLRYRNWILTIGPLERAVESSNTAKLLRIRYYVEKIRSPIARGQREEADA
jgi:hypothetical protein